MVATTDCKLWVMQRAVYHVIKQTALRQASAERRKLISGMPMLSMLSLVSWLACARHVQAHVCYYKLSPASHAYKGGCCKLALHAQHCPEAERERPHWGNQGPLLAHDSLQ